MIFWSGLKVFQDVLTDGETNFWLRQKKCHHGTSCCMHQGNLPGHAIEVGALA